MLTQHEIHEHAMLSGAECATEHVMQLDDAMPNIYVFSAQAMCNFVCSIESHYAELSAFDEIGITQKT